MTKNLLTGMPYNRHEMTHKMKGVGEMTTDKVSTELVRTEEPSVPQLMQLAIEKLGGEGGIQVVEVMERLVALQEHVEERNAKKDFAEAFSKFQSRCPSIPKTASTQETRTSGTTFGFTYAPLETIAEKVNPILSDLGFSYSWDWVEAEGDKIGQKCVLTHKAGHSRSATSIVPLSVTQRCNDTQKAGAAITYAKRYSLIQVLGLTTCEEDTGGGTVEKINTDSVATIETLLSEVGGNKERFLKYMNAGSIAEILTQDYDRAIAVLHEYRSKQR